MKKKGGGRKRSGWKTSAGTCSVVREELHPDRGGRLLSWGGKKMIKKEGRGGK